MNISLALKAPPCAQAPCQALYHENVVVPPASAGTTTITTKTRLGIRCGVLYHIHTFLTYLLTTLELTFNPKLYPGAALAPDEPY
jgi:hypothetical protein